MQCSEAPYSMTGYCWVPHAAILQEVLQLCRSVLWSEDSVCMSSVMVYVLLHLIAISAISMCSGCVCDLVVLLIADGGCLKSVLHVCSNAGLRFCVWWGSSQASSVSLTNNSISDSCTARSHLVQHNIKHTPKVHDSSCNVQHKTHG